MGDVTNEIAAHRLQPADAGKILEDDQVALGIRFLKHLQRTRLLLHIIDVAPLYQQQDPVADANKILQELQNYDKSLYRKPRWLVLNKLDLVPEDQHQQVCQAIIEGLDWQGPVYKISAINKTGVDRLCFDIMDFMEQSKSGMQDISDDE